MNPYGAISMGLFLLISTATWAQTQTKSSIDRGKAVYEQNCLPCHPADGRSVPKVAPTLINASYVVGDKSRLIGIILKGLKNAEIDGIVYEVPMPPFAALSDEDIAAVLSYIRNSFTNRAGTVTKQDVALIRQGG